MNMTEQGRFEAMPMLLPYKKYPLSIIRPLGLLEEREIIDAAGSLGLLASACTCPFGVNSNRKDIRKRLAAFTGSDGGIKRRILKAIEEKDG
jgi:tRNA 2-thiocytidine biosynthesis protein TtcA